MAGEWQGVLIAAALGGAMTAVVLLLAGRDVRDWMLCRERSTLPREQFAHVTAMRKKLEAGFASVRRLHEEAAARTPRCQCSWCQSDAPTLPREGGGATLG